MNERATVEEFREFLEYLQANVIEINDHELSVYVVSDSTCLQIIMQDLFDFKFTKVKMKNIYQIFFTRTPKILLRIKQYEGNGEKRSREYNLQ